MSRQTLSSTAQRSYWLGRYLERTESTARLVGVTSNLLYDLPRRQPLMWRSLIEITGSARLYDELYDETSERTVVRFVINDQRNPSSLINSLGQARENTRTLRGIIPRQAVEYVNELALFAREQLTEPLSRSRRAEGLSGVPELVQKFDGFASGNMLHDDHWQFLRLGNFIERADMNTRIVELGTSNLFQTTVELEAYSDIQWRSVLRALDAGQPYARVVQGPVSQPAVLEFLLQNRELPRSFAYAIRALRNNLRALPRHDQPLKAVNRLLRHVEASDVAALDGETLREWVDDCQQRLAQIHDVITKVYFDFKPRRKPQPRRKTAKRR